MRRLLHDFNTSETKYYMYMLMDSLTFSLHFILSALSTTVIKDYFITKECKLSVVRQPISVVTKSIA